MSRVIKKAPLSQTGHLELKGVGDVKLDGKAVEIAGFANKLVVDRGRDIINADAWELDNYKKNPVILFNHGMDPQLGSTPIGIATEIKPTEQGLFVRVRLSQIDDPIINRIRGLVKERILRAFSVGFEQKDADSDDGEVSRIKKAELFEISVVGVPMNQDSLFELTSKMLKTKSVFELKGEILKKKGALLASRIHSRIYEMMEEGKKRSELLTALSESTALSGDDLMNFLAGNVTGIAPEVISAMAETLELEANDLVELDKADVSLEDGGVMEEEEESSEDSEEPTIDLTDEAQALEEDASESDESDESEKSDESDEDDEEMKFSTDFAKKVNDALIEHFDSAVEDDDQMAAAVNSTAKISESVGYTAEDFKAWLKTCKKLRGNLKNEEPTTAIPAGNTEAENNDFGNPSLDMQKQTNVLLGALINEIQLMSRKLDVLATPQAEEEATTENAKTDMGDDDEEMTEEKARQSELDGYAKRLDAVKKRFDSLSLND